MRARAATILLLAAAFAAALGWERTSRRAELLDRLAHSDRLLARGQPADAARTLYALIRDLSGDAGRRRRAPSAEALDQVQQALDRRRPNEALLLLQGLGEDAPPLADLLAWRAHTMIGEPAPAQRALERLRARAAGLR